MKLDQTPLASRTAPNAVESNTDLTNQSFGKQSSSLPAVTLAKLGLMSAALLGAADAAPAVAGDPILPSILKSFDKARAANPIPEELRVKIENALKKFAQGNQGDAHFEAMYNLATGEASGKGWVLHRQKIGSYKAVHGWPPKVTTEPLYSYSVKQEIKFNFNASTGQVSGELNLGRGIRVKLSDLLFGLIK